MSLCPFTHMLTLERRFWDKMKCEVILLWNEMKGKITKIIFTEICLYILTYPYIKPVKILSNYYSFGCQT